MSTPKNSNRYATPLFKSLAATNRTMSRSTKGDPQWVSKRKAALAAEKDRKSAIVAQERQEVVAPVPAVEAKWEDVFVTDRKAEMAEQKKRSLEFAKRDLKSRGLGPFASPIQARLAQLDMHTTSRVPTGEITVLPPPSRPEQGMPIRPKTVVFVPNKLSSRSSSSFPDAKREPKNILVHKKRHSSPVKNAASKSAPGLHKILKMPPRISKTPFESSRRKEERWNEACRREAIKNRNELLKDRDNLVKTISTLGAYCEDSDCTHSKCKKIAADCEDLHDILKEVEEERLPAALREIERYGGESEEEKAKKKTEREAFAAEIRAGNEILAEQAQMNRVPYSEYTKFKMLDETNPWTDRPNYRPGHSRT